MQTARIHVTEIGARFARAINVFLSLQNVRVTLIVLEPTQFARTLGLATQHVRRVVLRVSLVRKASDARGRLVFKISANLRLSILTSTSFVFVRMLVRFSEGMQRVASPRRKARRS
jgi:hypothetical protein